MNRLEKASLSSHSSHGIPQPGAAPRALRQAGGSRATAHRTFSSPKKGAGGSAVRGQPRVLNSQLLPVAQEDSSGLRAARSRTPGRPASLPSGGAGGPAAPARRSGPPSARPAAAMSARGRGPRASGGAQRRPPEGVRPRLAPLHGPLPAPPGPVCRAASSRPPQFSQLFRAPCLPTPARGAADSRARVPTHSAAAAASRSWPGREPLLRLSPRPSSGPPPDWLRSLLSSPFRPPACPLPPSFLLLPPPAEPSRAESEPSQPGKERPRATQQPGDWAWAYGPATEGERRAGGRAAGPGPPRGVAAPSARRLPPPPPRPGAGGGSLGAEPSLHPAGGGGPLQALHRGEEAPDEGDSVGSPSLWSLG